MKLLKSIFRRAPAVLALGAGLTLIPAAGRAQPGLQAGDNRFLFVFSTSADMKKRLPAVKAELNDILATSLGGQLRSGNSIGVWTFGQNLRAGQFPPQHWRPEDAAAMADIINKFLRAQHYAGSNRFDALQPALDEVIRNSARLTVLIFCDGGDKINWTPYADGINQAFQQRLAEQKRAKQPFVLVLRAQLGNYVGCTMNFPPGMVNLPDFPPLPPPPPPVKTSPPAAVVKPPPAGPPLVIVGTHIFTNWPPPGLPPVPAVPMNVAPATSGNPVAPAIPPAPPLPTNPIPAPPTNPVAPEIPIAPPAPANPAPVIQTNAASPPTNPPVPAMSSRSSPANPVPARPVQPVAAATTNTVTPPENAGADHQGMILISGALLVVAGALAVFAWVRSRRTDPGSLITRSMRKD